MLETNGYAQAGILEPLPPLSPRERQVLEMAAQGMTNTRIGDELQLSVHGVKFHLSSIYRKLGVANRTEAANLYLRAQQSLEL